MLNEFRQFAIRGNVVDLAVGVVVGVAFGKIVDSLVRDVIMPPIGLALGRVDFSNLFLLLREGGQPGPYATVEAAAKAGAVTLNYGIFFNAVVSFLIVAWAVFLLVGLINRLRREEPAAAPVAPPEPPEEIRLLREIRDELKAR